MSMDDLLFLEQLMGGTAEEHSGTTGGVWVVSPEGALDEHMWRLVGKARVVADSLGAYVYLLAGNSGAGGDPQHAIAAGADQVLVTSGVPAVSDLVEFFRPREPQVVLFPHTEAGRVLGPGLAQVLGGSLCGLTADLAVDPIYQRILAHQPVLNDAARQVVSLLNSPAVAVVDTLALPAPFSEPWRNGQVEDTGLNWPAPAEFARQDMEAAPVTLQTSPVVVSAGRGLRDRSGFALAERLAAALGGVVAGDVGALDAGWIAEEQLVGLTGQSAAPRLYLALGIEGDTEHLAAVQGAVTVIAVQPDPQAPITQFADWNVIADPAAFAQELLQRLQAKA